MENKPKKNFVVTPEFREKMRLIVTGQKRSPETRAKMSASKLGKQMSQETRDRMRVSAYRRAAREKEERQDREAATNASEQ